MIAPAILSPTPLVLGLCHLEQLSPESKRNSELLLKGGKGVIKQEVWE